MSQQEFKGVIKLDIRDSKADWEPFLPPRAPEGAPNVLIILYDDTGQAAWQPYGGAINMPTLQKLADNGLTYTQWHTTALCSPTRSCFLTGRNHHLNGMSCITEASNGFPGWSGRIPENCMTIGQMLQDNGYSTFWLGKDHNVPEPDICSGGQCTSTPAQCDDTGNPCTEAACIDGACEELPVTGTACDDGDPCTQGESCNSGVCQGGLLPDLDLDGQVDEACGGMDCDDSDKSVFKGTDETCDDGIDNDGDGLIDYRAVDFGSADLYAGRDPECDSQGAFGVSEVPEPGAALLWTAGLTLLTVISRRKRAS